MTEDTAARENKIVITPEDIKRVNEGETDLSKIDITHPFDKPEFFGFLKKRFPGYEQAIKNSSRPASSQKLDEMETWETARILRRKARASFETDEGYLTRLLYEECFSVNQEPESPILSRKMGVAGLTPGGLVSHFFYQDSIDGFNIESASKLGLESQNLREAYSEMTKKGMDVEKIDAVISIIVGSTYPGDRQRSMFMRESLLNILKRSNVRYEEGLDSVGYRLIKMLGSAPEMIAEVEDKKLKALFGVKENISITRARLYKLAWSHFSFLIAENGTYKDPSGPAVSKKLEELLYFRTHPEMQIFFKYLSPSGYINEKT